MKKLYLVLLALCLFTLTGQAQRHSDWDAWQWLMGTWQGDGNGAPGEGSGTFHFATELDGSILVRKNHTEFPASDGRPEIRHDDLLIVYQDGSGMSSRAIYFDNEGHTIHYSITYGNNSIVLTSDRVPGLPVFRLIYSQPENGKVRTVFEISQDGEKFATYLEGTSSRIK